MRRVRGRWRLGWFPTIPIFAVGVAILVIAVAVFVGFRPAGPPAPGLQVPGPVVNASLTVGPPIGYHPADPFYSVVFNDGGSYIPTLQRLGAFFNSTPISFFRWGGQAGYDPTTSTLYQVPASGTGPYIAVPGAGATLNLAWSKSWCAARPQHCQWIGQLPAELNNTQAALHTAEWYHDVLGFAPTFWQLGNEPDAWAHYGENWTVWSTTDASTPTGVAYATMVRQYIATVHAQFPADRFVGIEASGPGNIDALTQLTGEVDGGEVAAMAYHSYPPPVGGGSIIDQLYASLVGPQNVSSTVNLFRSTVTAGCFSCADLPVQIGEFQAGPADAIDPLSLTYAGAPFLAAAIIEALRANVTTFTPFDSNWLINRTTGLVLPEGLLYQRILDNMSMGTDIATTLSAPGVGGLFSIAIENGTHESILVVNTNTSASIRLSIPPGVVQNGTAGSYWEWGPSIAFPVAYRSVALPASFEVPEQGILLVNNY